MADGPEHEVVVEPDGHVIRIREGRTLMSGAIDAGPDARAAMGAAGQARARRLYSAQAMCEATLAIYTTLLEGRE